jgi:serine/threonine-protein kinase
MGSVFEATHEYLGSAVALKFLNPELAERPGLIARFLQEARVSASIRSAHVVQVSDVDQTVEGLPYLVMELLEGESLQQRLNREQKLPMGTALEYAAQILNGLEVAHARSIVHRDLKPDNVYVVPTAHGSLLKLLDFGIAKLRTIAELQRGLTRPGALMGTPEYMAPEQAISADAVDHRADLYAVGVILFEMIAGCRPVQVDEPHVMAAMVLSGRVRRLADVAPGVPSTLSDAVARALAGRAEDRFGSAAEMRGALLPFFTASAQAVGMVNYPSMIAATPPMPPVRRGTAVLSAPAAQDNRPAPTQPGTDPDAGIGISPTLPPDDTNPDGRTGTVLGDGMVPGYGSPGVTNVGEYGATAEMLPMQFASEPAPALKYVPPVGKKKTSAWTILGILAVVLGALTAAAVIAFFVVDIEGGDEPGLIPTISPTVVVTSDGTGTADTVPSVTATVPAATATPTATTTARPPSRDAGPEGGFGFPGLPDGGLTLPPFPSSIPSSLPPITVPSAFPTFPIPGWPPPPPL